MSLLERIAGSNRGGDKEVSLERLLNYMRIVDLLTGHVFFNLLLPLLDYLGSIPILLNSVSSSCATS